MLPVLALVGRPNVGKSTLFNQLTRSRDALVADLSGLTRDRQYGQGRLDETAFIVIDTGGISGEELGIDAAMANQSMMAIAEADVVLLLVDGRAGLHSGDEALVAYLRSENKPFHLVVNKIDGVGEDIAASDFYQLGVEQIHSIAAAHNRGVRKLLAQVLSPWELEVTPSEPDATTEGIRVAIVGRPNVGKSTLVNRLLGEERVRLIRRALRAWLIYLEESHLWIYCRLETRVSIGIPSQCEVDVKSVTSTCKRTMLSA
jgi:GTP-binding protein